MDPLDKVPSLSELTSTFTELEALIFDMDGTVINSEVLHAQALHQLLADRNININAEDLLHDFKGISEPDVLEMLIEKKIVEPDTDLLEFVAVKNSYFENFLQDESFRLKIVFPEILKLLEDAKAASYKLALVTASERSTTELFLTKLKLDHYFDVILTRDDTERTKPDPMPYLVCFDKIEVQALNSVIFEDSDTGFAAALASGANVRRVCWYE